MKKHIAILMMISGLILHFGASPAKAGDPSPNDNFADAQPVVLTNGAATIPSWNWEATKETGEPNHAKNQGGKSVWFKFTPTATSAFTIQATQNNFDTLLAVYTGSSVNNLQTVGYNDDCGSTCGGASLVNLMLTAGTTYYIAVDGFSDTDTSGRGTFQLWLLENNPPINDNINGSVNLGTSNGGSIGGTNYNASLEANEPDHVSPAIPSVKSVWYKWTPTGDPVGMEFEVTFDFNAQIAVYSTSSGGAVPTYNELTKVASNWSYVGDSSTICRVKFFAETGKSYFIVVSGHNLNQANPNSGNFQLTYRQSKLSYSMDIYVRDRETSVSVFRPSEGIWYVKGSLEISNYDLFQWGTNGDKPMAADFDGNGDSELAIARNVNGYKYWYIRNIPVGSKVIPWGLATDKPLLGDFDGDSRADLAVIRLAATGYVWYVRRSLDGAMSNYYFGTTGDTPVLGDFDGDRRTEVAVVRNSQNGLVWYILKSEGNYGSYTSVQFGTGADIAAPEDYDGDGRTDLAVFRPSTGTWYIHRSSDSQVAIVQLGQNGDKPQPADYDGDGKADIAVFRPSTGNWSIIKSKTGAVHSLHFGATGDIPVSSLATLSQ